MTTSMISNFKHSWSQVLRALQTGCWRVTWDSSTNCWPWSSSETTSPTSEETQTKWPYSEKALGLQAPRYTLFRPFPEVTFLNHNLIKLLTRTKYVKKAHNPNIKYFALTGFFNSRHKNQQKADAESFDLSIGYNFMWEAITIIWRQCTRMM